ncbi:hemagglutinin repeat-containing protein [Neisseria leonii]|uniref:hemagglutinin repeat-containing protein n=1 Tax=Neisseria leonii TaxID=2995413 RepID=UPI00237B1531|nr:hemagglutinin repeat-containing protein [Neisseria sp. 3986]MDD9324815.1 hemagglutinin repeat-containing protein [Neisseria sp. 3986]
MAAANSGWQAYQAAQSIGNAVDSKGTGIHVNITYGEKRNESESHIRSTQSGGSTVTAGGSVNLTASGSGSDITVRGSDVAGKGGTFLSAENSANLLAAEQNHSERSNSQRGWNVGAALDFSNGVSVGVTVGGNYGKGYGNGSELSHRYSHIGHTDSQTVIQSGGDTTLRIGERPRRGTYRPKPQHRKCPRQRSLQQPSIPGRRPNHLRLRCQRQRGLQPKQNQCRSPQRKQTIGHLCR